MTFKFRFIERNRLFLEIHDLIPKDSQGQLQECQVHASSMMKYDSRPHEAMAATDTEKRGIIIFQNLWSKNSNFFQPFSACLVNI